MDQLRRAQAMNPAALPLACAVLAALACSSSTGQRQAEPPVASDGVAVRNLSRPGALEVENLGPAIDLAWAVSVEREQGGQWTVETTDLTLIETCGQPPPRACIHLERGTRLRPLPWNGLTCGAQCAASCRANVYLGPGRFRFVASSCDGERKFRGPAFELPAFDKKQ